MIEEPLPYSQSNTDAGTVDLLHDMAALRADIVNETRAAQGRIADTHAIYRDSARNLLHYLAMRRRDLRPLQPRLAMRGLSSLGRAESHVLATIDAVLDNLYCLADIVRPDADADAGDDGIGFAIGSNLLAQHEDLLFGPAANGRAVRIMVTMPAVAATDRTLVHDLLAQGMDCVRINCAHDDQATWSAIIDNVRQAEEALGRRCLVAMDLAGPKMRTGLLPDGPQVVRIQPTRDEYGRVTKPARVWLSTDGTRPAGAAQAYLTVSQAWLADLSQGDRVSLTDARERNRVLAVVEVTHTGCWLESKKTVYIVSQTLLRHHRSHQKGKGKLTRIGALPSRPGYLRLHEGDLLELTRDLLPGRAAQLGEDGRQVRPARIGCTLPEVFDDVQAGERVFFDDGKIGGIIERLEPSLMHVRITDASASGVKLVADKGINFPDSVLRVPALTAADREDLQFAAAHADIVQVSFANDASDVVLLQEAIAQVGEKPPAIILKIETRRGFEHLPDMLLAAMRSSCCGIMIARGDLAVEMGFERMAEVQEEILWMCEAAHVPVVWATQVLESLAKNGKPSRAEITDAAMSDRAECVMLNKGPHIVYAVKVLDDILTRMHGHQSKNRIGLSLPHQSFPYNSRIKRLALTISVSISAPIHFAGNHDVLTVSVK